jgi:hypothetical protein
VGCLAVGFDGFGDVDVAVLGDAVGVAALGGGARVGRAWTAGLLQAAAAAREATVRAVSAVMLRNE